MCDVTGAHWTPDHDNDDISLQTTLHKIYLSLKNCGLVSGAAAAVGASPTRGHGNERGHHLAGRGTVPQNLHPET